jgi:NDP-sugar pyrophosphorylase family protein
LIDHAVILAAGRGKRLGDLVAATPKPLLEVGGRPLIDRIIEALSHNGVQRFTVVTGYLADQLEAHLSDRWGDAVAFVRQDEPRGTAHALLLARGPCAGAGFVLAWGDIAIAGGAYGSVLRGVRPADDVVLGVNWVEDPSQGASVVFTDDGVVSKIVEKPSSPPPSHWNNAGIMVLSPSIWPHVDAVEPSSRGEYELTDALAALMKSGGVVRAIRLRGPWFDIGTVNGLEGARASFG